MVSKGLILCIFGFVGDCKEVEGKMSLHFYVVEPFIEFFMYKKSKTISKV